jgi:hypothetical protein
MSDQQKNFPSEEFSTGELPNFVFDMNFRQIFFGDYVVLPCFNSIVDRGMVVAVAGSTCEMVILSPETGIPETVVLDLRHPDPHTRLFGRYGYFGVQVVARKGEAQAQDFARQLLAACQEIARNAPRFNPFMVAQARARADFLKQLLQ